jgi:hypothetical protein
MPIWLQYILYAAALAGAMGVLWKKVFRPTAKLITTTEKMLPLLVELTEVFEKTPNAFKVLDEIVAQFRTDSGSSLRDVVNRLDEAAKENRTSADTLKVGVETARQLAEQDREQLRRLIILLDRLTIRVDAGGATGLRIEHAAEVVAEGLAAQKASEEKK